MAQRILLAFLWRLLKAPSFVRLIFIKLLIWLSLRAKLTRICKDMKISLKDFSEQEIDTLARLSISNVYKTPTISDNNLNFLISNPLN